MQWWLDLRCCESIKLSFRWLRGSIYQRIFFVVKSIGKNTTINFVLLQDCYPMESQVLIDSSKQLILNLPRCHNLYIPWTIFNNIYNIIIPLWSGLFSTYFTNVDKCTNFFPSTSVIQTVFNTFLSMLDTRFHGMIKVARLLPIVAIKLFQF